MSDAQIAVLYGAASPVYFDTPDRVTDNETRYAHGCGKVPSGWRRSQHGLWVTMVPDGFPRAEQGWKIHLSATQETAETVLDRAVAVFTAHNIAYKFLRSKAALSLMSAKHMPRSASGKFITAYPADCVRLEEVLADLVPVVDGLPGPYILSDLRIGRGPVHVRYGAFVEQWCAGEDGRPVHALRGPSGELVPDIRGPVFHLPEWVDLPFCLEPHLAAREAARDDDFPYVVREALHFSNAGGVYLAEHRTSGRRVVLREARPFSGLDGMGSDAVERLHREYRTLMRLQGLNCVPAIHGLRSVWEHHFLIEEYIEGQTLLEAMVTRYPAQGRDTSEEARRAYARWVATVTGNLTAALDAIHARGVSFRDVHPANIIVRPDDSVVLVDFEYASDLDTSDLPRVGAAGFMAPAGATGLQADQHGLWATWLSLFMPMVEMLGHDSSKGPAIEFAAREYFRLSATEGPHRPMIGGPIVNPSAAETEDVFSWAVLDWPALRDSLVAGIRACATPERDDLLFPAHWSVFDTGGHTLAHGSAGVLLALHRAGAQVPAEYVDWLVGATRRTRPATAGGVYDGLYGVALALVELGRLDQALDVFSRARAAGLPATPGLSGGQTGVGLSLCRFAAHTGDEALLNEALRIAEQLDVLLREGRQNSLQLPHTAGLLHGFSGVALLHLRLYRITGEQRHLLAARAALGRDLEHCVAMPDGTTQVKQGHRNLLYLGEGSGGMALVAREYLMHADDAELSAFTTSVAAGCSAHFVREPGLFRGRAGIIAAHSLLAESPQCEEVLASIRRLSWHAVRKEGGVFFPGMGLTRLSADLATGSAGVLLALHTVFEGKGDLSALLPCT